MTALNANSHAVDDAELEALLGDEQGQFFDDDDDSNELVAAEHDVTDDELSSILADADADQNEDIDEELAAALSEVPDEETAEPVKAEPVKAKTKAEPKEAKERAPSTAGLKPDAAIRTKLGDKVYDILVIDDDHTEHAAIDALLKRADELPKKVGEKIANVAYHLANGVRLSCYTETAIKLLKEHGEITIKNIKEAYLAHPYSPGTANAQASQMKQVLPFLGLAESIGDRLVKNEGSILLDMLAN